MQKPDPPQHGLPRRSFLLSGAAAAGGAAFLSPHEAKAISTVTTANVRSYGAVGDGKHDDTQAIITALAANDSVEFPPGVYLVTSQILVPKGKGIYGANVGSGPRWNWQTNSWDLTYVGSVIAVGWGAGGTAASNAAILMSSFSVVAGFQFWHPNQSGSTSTPTQYPPPLRS